MSDSPTIWIVTDGATGNEKQCLALAHYLRVEPTVFRLSLRQPWEWLAPHFRSGGRRAIIGPLRDALNGALPDLLITCGRRATLASTTIKRLSGGKTFTAHLLDPKINPGLFDMVICPRHDQLSGANVVDTLGALNAIDDSSLLEARRQWAPQIVEHPAPRFAVLIGASNDAYDIDTALINQMSDTIDLWLAEHGGSVMVTTSRRTPDELKALVWQRFGGKGRIWTGTENIANPYLGFLAYADAVVATPDSVNMCSEAAATGKPIYVPSLPSNRAKFDRFHQALRDAGHERDLLAPLELSETQPLRETEALADQVMATFRATRNTERTTAER